MFKHMDILRMYIHYVHTFMLYLIATYMSEYLVHKDLKWNLIFAILKWLPPETSYFQQKYDFNNL